MSGNEQGKKANNIPKPKKINRLSQTEFSESKLKKDRSSFHCNDVVSLNSFSNCGF